VSGVSEEEKSRSPRGVCVCVLFSPQYWGLNSGPTPRAILQPFFVIGLFEIGSQKLLSLAGFEL
jgi:hypothetical protein